MYQWNDVIHVLSCSLFYAYFLELYKSLNTKEFCVTRIHYNKIYSMFHWSKLSVLERFDDYAAIIISRIK